MPSTTGNVYGRSRGGKSRDYLRRIMRIMNKDRHPKRTHPRKGSPGGAPTRERRPQVSTRINSDDHRPAYLRDGPWLRSVSLCHGTVASAHGFVSPSKLRGLSYLHYENRIASA